MDKRQVVAEEAGQVARILVGDSPPAEAHSEEITHPTEPTSVVPTPATADQPTRARFNFDVREWSVFQWVLAIIGLIIGLVVALYTWHPLFSDIHGSGRGTLVTLWFVFLAILGFGLGGLCGWLFFDNEETP